MDGYIPRWIYGRMKKRNIKKNHEKHRFYKMMNKIYVAGNLTTMKKSILNIIGKGAYKILFRNKDYKYWNKKVIDMVTPEGTYVGDRIWPVEDKEFSLKKYFQRQNMLITEKEEDRVFHDFEGYIK